MQKQSHKPTACPHCQQSAFRKKGYYYKKITKTYIPRYICLHCHKNFSTRTTSKTYRQKRPDLNPLIYQALCCGVTLRQTARNLQCSYRTVIKKFHFIASLAQSAHDQKTFHIEELQFDEMETIEHTKLKPLTIALAVSSDYQILDLKVGKIPAKGHLAAIAVKKYGPRENESTQVMNSVLGRVKQLTKDQMFNIKSDSKPTYNALVKRHFPKQAYTQVIARNQIEKKREAKHSSLEKKIFDPMFALNQRCAKLRADIRRLTRRSWCTTKKIENLQKHLDIYRAHNNQYQLF